MGAKSRKKVLEAQTVKYAAIFAALGDPIRLALVNKLSDGTAKSISSLTDGTKVTRQAVTKHLRVLEDAGLVQGSRIGRENLFELDLRPFKDMKDYLKFVSNQWDAALLRLQAFVEDDDE
ncbi:MAG: transcriptional regulator [Cyanobacteria bacterium PR.3.49]|nr:transcriptional regulator [Cyanobacteria bacterium PR.3.49]